MPEERMSREQLDEPEVQAAIAKAKERARNPVKGSGGSNREDLLRLAREQRRVGTRT